MRQHKKFFIVNKIRRKVYKIRACIVVKDAVAKNFVSNEHHSFTFVFAFRHRRRRPADRLHLKFPFSAETDVFVSVFS